MFVWCLCLAAVNQHTSRSCTVDAVRIAWLTSTLRHSTFYPFYASSTDHAVKRLEILGSELHDFMCERHMAYMSHGRITRINVRNSDIYRAILE